MATEQVQLVAPGGQSAPASADITRPSQHVKMFWAVTVLVVGFGLGAASIIIPILHFFSTWILPLTAVLVARKILNSKFSVTEVRGTCPACGKELDLGDRSMPNSEWQHCPHCEARLQIVPTAATAG